MRKVRVLKFGGTSAGNGERIHHVARIIASVKRLPERLITPNFRGKYCPNVHS